MVTDAQVADVLERAADIVEAEGYDPSNYVNCDGAYCQVGAIAAAMGLEPDPYFPGDGEDYVAMRAVCEALHPERPDPDCESAADPYFQRERYPAGRPAVVAHMRETAARLTEQPDLQPARAREEVLA